MEVNKITTVRNEYFVKMEFTVTLWISDCKKKNIPLYGKIIRRKARKLDQQFDGREEGKAIGELHPRPLISPRYKNVQTTKGLFNRF